MDGILAEYAKFNDVVKEGWFYFHLLGSRSKFNDVFKGTLFDFWGLNISLLLGA